MKEERKAVLARRILVGGELTELKNGCVLIEKDRILDIVSGETCASVMNKAEVTDLGDVTVLPGLFDCHTHLALDAGLKGHLDMMSLPEADQERLARAGMKKDLAAGVTTARCMGDRYYLDLKMKKMVEEGRAEGPDLLVCGIGMRSAKGHGYVALAHTGASQFGATAAENIRRGADHLKIFVTPGIPAASPGEDIPCYLSEEEIAAVTQKAGEEGISVTAHCTGGPGLERCVRLGVDTLEHLYSITPEQIRFLEDHFGGWADLTSGIVLDEGREAFTPESQNIKMRRARPYSAECLHRLCESRYLRFTLGSDAYHGMLWKEVEFAAACGLARREALKGITVYAAAMTGTGSFKGQISPGYRADLIAVRENPLTCPKALSHVGFVMKKGKIISNHL